jgi:hypothetical protein
MIPKGSMPSKKPGYSVRLWVSNDDLEKLKGLADRTEITQVEIMTRIMHAGVEAVSQTGVLTLPLRFEIVEHDRPVPVSAGVQQRNIVKK